MYHTQLTSPVVIFANKISTSLSHYSKILIQRSSYNSINNYEVQIQCNNLSLGTTGIDSNGPLPSDSVLDG